MRQRYKEDHDHSNDEFDQPGKDCHEQTGREADDVARIEHDTTLQLRAVQTLDLHILLPDCE